MKKKPYKEPSSGVLTDRMDTDSQEFKDFQALLLNKSKSRSEKRKTEIELLALKFKMEDYLNSDDNDMKLAGEFLKSFLAIANIRQNKFANYIGLRPSNLNKVIGGERAINHEIALILGRIFNMDPLLWLSVQAKNELKKLSASEKTKFKKYSFEGLHKAVTQSS